jgi:acyl carrier protein
VAPRTHLEEQLAAIWGEVLSLEHIGVHDDFFALGGHSLQTMQVLTRLHERLDVELPLHTLFEAPTVDQLAVAITQRQAESEQPDDIAQLLAELEGLSDADLSALLTEETR